MTSLYNRATPAQAQVLRIIEGAVKNAHDAHALEYDPRMARSIAKRAAGTLTAQWPDVLAAKSLSPSDSAGSDLMEVRPAGSQVCKGRRSSQPRMASRRGPSHREGRSPLRQLWKQLSYMAGAAKEAGDSVRLTAIQDVLRMVAKMEKES